MSVIRVLIYEDNRDLSDSLSALLRGTDGFRLVGAFPNCSNVLEQLLWLVAFGDFVTLYLGILNGLNPAPVDLVEKFKKAMDE